MALVLVEEELPLKQGLKLANEQLKLLIIIVEEELPLKQGLKHSVYNSNNKRCES